MNSKHLNKKTKDKKENKRRRRDDISPWIKIRKVSFKEVFLHSGYYADPLQKRTNCREGICDLLTCSILGLAFYLLFFRLYLLSILMFLLFVCIDGIVNIRVKKNLSYFFYLLIRLFNSAILGLALFSFIYIGKVLPIVFAALNIALYTLYNNTRMVR